jgi:hypothetical protein
MICGGGGMKVYAADDPQLQAQVGGGLQHLGNHNQAYRLLLPHHQRLGQRRYVSASLSVLCPTDVLSLRDLITHTHTHTHRDLAGGALRAVQHHPALHLLHSVRATPSSPSSSLHRPSQQLRHSHMIVQCVCVQCVCACVCVCVCVWLGSRCTRTTPTTACGSSSFSCPQHSAPSSQRAWVRHTRPHARVTCR